MNNINEFNEGGSHGMNPLGGIPVGTNPQTGQLQTVEEGETMATVGGEDYIYSNKYQLTAEDISNFSLPKMLSGLSISDATKKLNDVYGDRDDSISTSTKSNFLDRIAEIQEMKKAEEEAKIQEAMMINDANNFIDSEGLPQEPMMPEEMIDPITMSPDMNMGAMNPMQSQFEMGGTLGGMSGSTGGSPDYAGAAMGTLQLFDQAKGNTSPKAGTAALTGAATGASVGTMIFPGIGTAIGAGVGAIAGFIGGSAADKKVLKRGENAASMANKQFSDIEQFAKGGRKQSTFLNPTPVGYQNQGIPNDFINNTNIIPVNTTVPVQNTNRNNSFNVNGNQLMRFAPIVNNLSQLNSQSAPTVKDPIINKELAQRRYVDREALINPINVQTNNSLRALNQLGGSTGARRSAIVATNIARNRAVSEANINANNINRQVDIQADAQDFQRRDTNLNRLAVAQENYDRDLGAYLTNRSQLQNTMANSIGAIGLENMNREKVGNMFGYNEQGNFINKDTNGSYTPISDGQYAQIQQAIAEADRTGDVRTATMLRRQAEQIKRAQASMNAAKVGGLALGTHYNTYEK